MPIRHATLHQLKSFDALAPHVSVARTAKAFFRRHGTSLQTRREMGSNEAIKQTVAGRLLGGILSRSAVQSELAGG